MCSRSPERIRGFHVTLYILDISVVPSRLEISRKNPPPKFSTTSLIPVRSPAQAQNVTNNSNVRLRTKNFFVNVVDLEMHDSESGMIFLRTVRLFDNILRMLDTHNEH